MDIVDKRGIHSVSEIKSELAKSLVYGGKMPYVLRYCLADESGLDVYRNADISQGKSARHIYPKTTFTLENISALDAYLDALKKHKTTLEKYIAPANDYVVHLAKADLKSGLVSHMIDEEDKFGDNYGAFFDHLCHSLKKEDFEILIKDILPSIEICFAPKISGISTLFNGIADIVLRSGGPRKKSGSLSQSYRDAKKKVLDFLKKESLSADGYNMLFDAFDTGKPKDEELDFLDIYRQLFIDWSEKSAIMRGRYDSFLGALDLINSDIHNLSEISYYFKEVAFIRDTYLEIKDRKANQAKISLLKSKSEKTMQKMQELEKKIDSKKQEHLDNQSGEDLIIKKHADFYRKLEKSGLRRPEIDAIYYFANNHHYDIRDFNDLQTFWRKEIRDKKWWKTVDQSTEVYDFYSAVRDMFSDISDREDAITAAIFRTKDLNELNAERSAAIKAIEDRQRTYDSEISALSDKLRKEETEYSADVREIDGIQESLFDPQLNRNIEKSIRLMDKAHVGQVVFPLNEENVMTDYILKRSELESALSSPAATRI